MITTIATNGNHIILIPINGFTIYINAIFAFLAPSRYISTVIFGELSGFAYQFTIQIGSINIIDSSQAKFYILFQIRGLKQRFGNLNMQTIPGKLGFLFNTLIIPISCYFNVLPVLIIHRWRTPRTVITYHKLCCVIVGNFVRCLFCTSTSQQNEKC